MLLADTLHINDVKPGGNAIATRESEQVEPSNHAWAADLEVINTNEPNNKLNRFFAREIEVSDAEFEKLLELYEHATMTGAEAIKKKETGAGDGYSCDHATYSASSPTTPTALMASPRSSIRLDMPKRRRNGFGFRNRYQSCFGMPVISPFATWYQAWRWTILALDATYAAFMIPIQTALQFQDAGSAADFSSWTTITELVVTFLYLIDIFVQFSAAWIAISPDLRQILVIDGTNIAKFYLRKGFFFDVITTVPIVLELIISLSMSAMDEIPGWVAAITPWIRVLRLLRFVRVFRVCKLDFLSRITAGADIISPSVSSLIMLCYFIAFGVNILGCMWYMIAWYGGSENSWLTTKSIMFKVGEQDDGSGPEYESRPLAELSFTQQYIASLYWATTTVTTVGYGDIVPANPFEMGIACLVEFLGVLVFGLLIGTLSAVFIDNSRDTRRSQLLRDRLQEASEWMNACHLPKDLRQAVQAFYRDVWKRQLMTHDDAKMLQDLPVSIRSKVILTILKASDKCWRSGLLHWLPDGMQQLLAGSLVPVTVCSGQDLIKEGRRAEHIWLLQSGEIAELHKLRVVSLQAAPQCLGLLNLANVLLEGQAAVGRRSVCGYRSVVLSTAWQIELADLEGIFDAYPRARRDVLRYSIRQIESSLLTPSPVEQWDTVASQLLEKLQRLAVEEFGGIVRSGSKLSHSDSSTEAFEISPENMQKLRQRQMEIKIGDRLRDVLRHVRGLNVRPKFDRGACQSHWQMLVMYVPATLVDLRFGPHP
eukprot:jgi/Tetstr1/420727/TSEL_011810.t1